MKRGDRVLLQLRSLEVFEGTVERFSQKSVELTNVFCQSTNTPYDGNMAFFRNEVVKVSVLTKSPNPEDVPQVNGVAFGSTERITMDQGEFDRLRRMTFDFVFINTFGKSFDNAIETLSNRESLAVVGLGPISRSRPLNLLVIADFKQVFIFDLFCLVELKNLKDILESTYISKVVHGGVVLNDCLYHKYGVQMNNVFDTQIIDSSLSEEEGNTCEKRNISECLTHHFKFPSSLLSAAIDETNTWTDRPLTKSEKVKAAQLATYLLSLRDALMSRILEKYTKRIVGEYNKYRDTDDIHFIKFKLRSQ